MELGDLFDDEKQATADASAALPTRIDPKAEVPPAQATTPSEPSLVEGVGEAFADTGRAIGRGVEDAGRGVMETGRQVINAGVKALTPPFLRDKLPEDGVVPDMMKGEEHVFDEPTHVVNQLAGGVVEFGLAQLGGNKILNMLGRASAAAPTVMSGIADSAVGTAAVADPHGQRMSDAVNNLAVKYPILENPITEFLASDPNDSFAVGKFKATLEDMMANPVAMVLFHGVAGLKNRLLGRSDALDMEAIQKNLAAAEDASKAGPTEKYPVEPDVIQMEPVVVNGQAMSEAEKNSVKASLSDNVSTNGNVNGNGKAPLTKTVATEEGEQITSNTPGLSLTAHMDDAKKSLFIDRIEVGEDLRSNGMGRQAVQELEATAVAKGAKTITGEALPNSEEFWKKMGFKVGEPEEGVGLRPISKELNGNGAAPEAAPVVEPKPAIDIQNSKGDSIFRINDEQRDTFLKQLDSDLDAGRRGDTLTVPVENFFNLKKMDTPIETQRVLTAVADLVAPSVEKKMGKVQTLEMVQDQADTLGITPEKLMGNLSTLSQHADKMAATVLAGKIAAQSLSDHIFRLGRSIYMGEGGESAKVEMLRAIDILGEIQGMAKSIQTGAARTTSAGRIRSTAAYNAEDLRKLMAEQDPKQMDDLVKTIALSEGNPKAISKIIQTESYFKKALETHNEYFINAILSKPATHVINILSAFDNALMQPFFQVAGGAMKLDKSAVMNGLRTWKALGTNAWDSMEMARRVLATDKEMLDPGKGTIEGRPGSLSARNWNLDEKSILGVGVDALGYVTRMTSRALRGEDEFFKQINYRAKLTANAAGEAQDLVKAGKLNVADMQSFIDKRFQEAFELQGTGVKGRMVNGEKIGPQGDILRQTFGKDEAALKYANEGTFTQGVSDVKTWGDLPSMGEIVTRAAGHPAIRGAIIPFVKVPTNIFREGMNVGPAALLRRQFYADVQAGGDKAAVAIGKLGMGTLFWTGAMGMAAEGMVTGNVPGDKDVRERLLETGWKPYSIVSTDANGKKYYTPINRLDPRFMPLTLAADFWQITHSVDEDVRNNLATHMTMALAQNLSSKLYLKGIIDMASNVRAGFSNPDIAAKMIQQKMASYVPGAVQLLQSDDELKAVRSVMDAVIAKIPGWSETLEAKRDYFGNKKVAEPGMQWSAINPFAGSEEKADPVAKEIARLATSSAEAKFTMPPTQLGNVDLLNVKNSKGQTAYDRWTELAGTVEARSGKNFHDRLAELMDSDRYKSGTDGNSLYQTGSKVMMIRNEREHYLEAAKRQMVKEFSDDPAAKFPGGKTMKDILQIDTQTEKSMKRGKDQGIPDFLQVMQ